VIGIRGLRGAAMTLGAVVALAGCGAVTSEQQKLESSVKHKVKSVAQHGVSSFTQKDLHINLPCHASPAHFKSIYTAVLKKYGSDLPSPSVLTHAIERAVCR
jgi:hypothetical protein